MGNYEREDLPFAGAPVYRELKMKKLLSLSVLALFLAGCESTAQQTSNTNAGISPDNSSAIVSSHSGEAKDVQTSAPMSQKSSGGESSPMAKAVDVSAMTADIEKSEAAYKQNPQDKKAKDNLAKAYFVRAFALTDAAQYRAALGDFRKGLKLDPKDEAAQKMHDEIIRIFKSINREPPKEGEEPAPMPIKKA